MHRRLACFRLFLLGALAFTPAVFAQGVTGAALTGIVRDPDGAGVPEAGIELRNPTTGDVYQATSDASGEYNLDNVAPGGPYTLTINAPGYEPKTRNNIRLALGQRVKLDIDLKYFGEAMEIVSHNDVLDDKHRDGINTTVKEQTISQLPLQSRNFTDLANTSPIVSGSSVAGTNNRYNNIQIDGGANNDLFGLAGNGTPGGQANAKALSVEAIQEFTVNVSPFDVRQGNFTGGLINAITKSGTNDVHGTIFGYLQNKSLAGNQSDPTFLDYKTYQYGAVLSGPIIQDKAHFFIAADLQTSNQSYGSIYQLTGDPTYDASHAGFTTATAQRFINDLNAKGIANPGDYTAPTLGNPTQNLFIKADTNQIPNSRLELTYNYVNAKLDILSRSPTGVFLSPGSLRGGYELSNAGYTQANTTNTVRAKLTSSFDGGHLSNEFLAGASFIRDHRDTPTNVPLILVDTGGKLGASDTWLSAGEERFSQANILDQNILEITDNLTYSAGDHRVTVGTSNQFFHFRNVFLQAAEGAYAFNSLDDFEAGKVAYFQRRFAPAGSPQDPGTAKFNVQQYGFYAQDEYTPVSNFSVRPGVRVDVPFLSSAYQNPALLTAALPIDTTQIPSGNLLWSPRLGFNWDVDGTQDTVVRGGAGVFTGRPPYVWVSNAYAINGLSQVELNCDAKKGPVPAFTTDPANQPTSCTGGSGSVPAPTNVGEVDFFDPNTKYPQNFRLSLGVDRRLPFGIVGSFDFLYSRDINAWYTTDANLTPVGVSSEGRVLYGALGTSVSNGNTSLSVTPNRIDPTHLTNAVIVYNKSGGYSPSATIQLSKALGQIYAISVAYTYSRSFDRMSLTSSQAFSNYQFSPLDGSLDNRAVRPSAFDRPHKITVTGTAQLPYGFGVGLTYTGISGTPYTWNVSGDVNGDGVNGNDVPFIPANASQITLKDPTQYAALDQFINSQDCLNAARGQLLQRGACRNPWSNLMDVRLQWASPEIKGQKFEVQMDIFDFLNLINSNWGQFNSVTGFETASATFLKAVGYDKVNNRPIYTFADPTAGNSLGLARTILTPTSSRWRIQFGARYIF